MELTILAKIVICTYLLFTIPGFSIAENVPYAIFSNNDNFSTIQIGIIIYQLVLNIEFYSNI